MSFASSLTYRVYPKNVTFQPKCVVLLLHGYGSNAEDLISLAPDLAESLPEETVFLSPNAPFKFEGGAQGAYQWYSLERRDSSFLQSGYEAAEPKLAKFVADVLNYYKIEPSQLIMLGFSQGGMMTLHFGLSYPSSLGGLISCSGYLLDGGVAVRNTSPVFMSHGMLDMVVPVDLFEYSLNTLKTYGIDVDTVLSPGLAHGIDYVCIDRINNFLKRIQSSGNE